MYKVRSRVKGFKPMAKLFKGNTDNLEEGINQILSLVKNPVGHLAKTFLTSSLEDVPHTVKPSPRPPIRKPQLPPRESSLPLEDLEVTISEETFHDVVQDLKKDQPQKFKGYIKKLKEQAPQASARQSTSQF